MIKRETNRYIAILIIGLFCLMIANKAVFLHSSHQLPNGNTIIHAHPFNTSNDPKPLKTHFHSVLSILSLHITDLLFLISILIPVFSALILLNSLSQRQTSCISILFNFKLNGRSPPLLIF